MEAVSMKELILDGLDCANCAAKIEAKVNKLEGVSRASMNFVNKTLTIEISDKDRIDDILSETKKIVNIMEPDVNIREKIIQKSSKKVYVLMGLGCANCAAKIEREVGSLAGIKSASVDFASKKLSIETHSRYDSEDMMNEVMSIVKRIEPDVNLIEDTKENKKALKDEEDDDKSDKGELIRLGIGAALFVTGMVVKLPFWAELTVFLTSYILVGGEVVVKAIKILQAVRYLMRTS